MPLKLNYKTTAEFKRKVGVLMDGIKEAMPLAGEVVAESIVRTTLQGIGAGDSTFAPYSPGYQRLIDAVGGKPGGVVDLRGIFVKEEYGGKPRKAKDKDKKVLRGSRATLAGIFGIEFDSTHTHHGSGSFGKVTKKGGGRRAYVQVTIGSRSFSALTKPTRNRMGINDPQSEMSADLIHVIARDDGFRLEYRPRLNEYMVKHNENRPWFSTDKAAVKAALARFLATVLRALIRNFNA